MNKEYYGKVALSFILAFFLSALITTYVTYPDKPNIRPEFTVSITQIPTKVIASIQGLTNTIASLAFLPRNALISQLPDTYNPPADEIVYPTSANVPDVPDEVLPSPPPVYNPLPTQPQPTLPIDPTAPIQLPTALPPTQPPTKTVEESRVEFLAIINKYRSPLTLNPLLTASAQKYADLLTQKLQSGEGTLQTLCTHEYGGTTPQSRAQKEGFSGGFVSENAYCGPASAQVAFDSWMSDDLHKNNMLSSSWHQAGIGVSGFWVLDLAP